MPDEFGKYTPEEALQEASVLKEKISSGEAFGYDEAERQVERTPELESVEILRQRVIFTLRNLYLMPVPTIDQDVYLLLRPKELIKAVQVQDSLEHLSDDQKELHGFSKLEWSHHELENSVDENMRVAEQWNMPWNYDNLLFAALTCLDDGRMEDNLQEYIKMTCEASKCRNSDEMDLYESRVFETFMTLLQNMQDVKAIDGMDILEIGGKGFEAQLASGIWGEPKKITSTSSERNEDSFASPISIATRVSSENGEVDNHVTSSNYKDFYGDRQFDLTLTRCVFEPGSGVRTGDMSEKDSMVDLLKVLSAVTKGGGFSIHEGLNADFDDELLEKLGFEKVLSIEVKKCIIVAYETGELETINSGVVVDGIANDACRGDHSYSMGVERLLYEQKDRTHIAVTNDSNQGRHVCILRKK